MRDITKRALIDLAAGTAFAVLLLLAMWAYQGHQAYQFLQQTIQQQRAAQPAK